MRQTWSLPVRAAAAVCLATTTAVVGLVVSGLWLTSAVQGNDFWEAAGVLGSATFDDAAWLFPLMFGAVVAVLALLVAQSFVGLPTGEADLHGRRLAAACLVIAGLTLALLVVVALGAVDERTLVPHLLSVGLAAALTAGIALWLATVIFGPSAQQFRILGHHLGDVNRLVDEIPRSANVAWPIRRLILAVTVSTVAAAMVGVLGCSAVLQPRHVAGQIALTVADLGAAIALALLVGVVGTALATMAAYLRDSAATAWGGVAVATLYSAATVAAPAASFVAERLHSGAQLPLFVLVLVPFVGPVAITAIVPRNAFGGRTLRGAVDAIRLRYLTRRRIQLRAARVALTQVRTPSSHRGWTR